MHKDLEDIKYITCNMISYHKMIQLLSSKLDSSAQIDPDDWVEAILGSYSQDDHLETDDREQVLVLQWDRQTEELILYEDSIDTIEKVLDVVIVSEPQKSWALLAVRMGDEEFQTAFDLVLEGKAQIAIVVKQHFL